MQESNSLREHNNFCQWCRPQTTQYARIISNLSRCLVIIPKWAGLAPWCCGNECFFVSLGGHVLEERPLSPPKKLGSRNELCTARTCVPPTFASSFTGASHVKLLRFFSRIKGGLVDGRVNKGSGNRGRSLCRRRFF